jgi:hypothetical protein
MIKDFKKMIVNELDKTDTLIFNASQRRNLISKIGKDRKHERPCLKQADVRKAIHDIGKEHSNKQQK